MLILLMTIGLAQAGIVDEQIARCEAGKLESCWVAAAGRFDGEGDRRDVAQAAALAERGCVASDTRACLQEARIRLETGTPTRSPIREVLAEACASNTANACALRGAVLVAGVGGDAEPLDGFAILQEECVKSDVLACAWLGRLTLDPARSASALLSACEGGYGDACAWRAAQLDRAEAGPDQLLQARALYERGCAARSGAACGALGRSLNPGRIGAPDPARALEVLTRACELRDAPSCTAAAGLQRGPGALQRDDVRARHLLRLACELGDLDGCVGHAQMLELGQGGGLDQTSSLAAYRLACDQGQGLACYHVAGQLKRGRGTSPDAAGAARFLERACASHYPAACGEAATSLAAESPTRAATLLSVGCVDNDGASCAALSAQYRDGSGVPQDEAAALALQARACRLGERDACR